MDRHSWWSTIICGKRRRQHRQTDHTDGIVGRRWNAKLQHRVNLQMKRVSHVICDLCSVTFISHAGVSWCMGTLISCCCMCVWVCVSLCPCSTRRIAWTINTKLGRHTLHGSRSTCIDREVKRSRSSSRGCQIHCTLGFACRYNCLGFLVIGPILWGHSGTRYGPIEWAQ